ncbi:MAG: isoprenylcysteine carboxylmethyltransferase family protein [Azoarcus sp.]|nr:isoprenylcysteine carboxylmethyltransferase family protein [Azoarcus sp.]
MQALQLKIPPPVVATLIATAMWIAAHGFSGAPSTSFGLTFGGPVALFGGAISAAGSFAFWRARTTINPLHPEKSSHLVTSGVFRYSRNPMYLGLVITLSGWAIHLPSQLPFLGPAAFALYIHHFQILPEERILLALFGAEYERYRTRVRRWF